jgi:hypothetical protein
MLTTLTVADYLFLYSQRKYVCRVYKQTQVSLHAKCTSCGATGLQNCLRSTEYAALTDIPINCKLLLAQAMTQKMQYHTDRMATVLEKASNLMTWSDWRVSTASTLTATTYTSEVL